MLVSRRGEGGEDRRIQEGQSRLQYALSPLYQFGDSLWELLFVLYDVLWCYYTIGDVCLLWEYCERFGQPQEGSNSIDCCWIWMREWR